MKYPEKLIKGNKIGVTATSMGLTTEAYFNKLDLAYKKINSYGFDIIETLNVRTSEKLASSSGQTRAMEFMQLWKNEKINCIAQVRGGEFLIEMLPYIDYNTIINNKPKWVFGYSDSSLLNFYLTTKFNIATITSDNIMSFAMEPVHESLHTIIDILKGNSCITQNNFALFEKDKFSVEERKLNHNYNLTEKVEYKNLYYNTNESFEGRILGGCIDCLTQLLGTPYDNTVNFCNQFPEGIIWYLENCELTTPSLYRALLQIKNSNWFFNTKGFLIGRTRSNATVEDFDYFDVLHKIFDDFNVPVIYDIDTGHVAPQFPIVNGSYAKFKYNNGKGELIQILK